LIAPKIAVVAPMPSANMRIALAVNIGVRPKTRAA